MSGPVCVVPAGDRCGEGVVWAAEEAAVYWTDINRFLIHRYDTGTGSTRSWLFEEPVVALGLTDRSGLILVALGSGLIFWNPRTDARREHGFRLPGWPEVRLNDGRPDPVGNFWVGSMKNNVGPDGEEGEVGPGLGSLYRIAADGAVSVCAGEIGICNTLCWSPDHSRFYFADTLANVIWEHDFETGRIGQPRTFFAGFDRGFPDGSAIDADGYLWNCRFGGGCVVRLAPDGSVDRVIEMPVLNPTTCTFGGPELRTLFITSASLHARSGDRLAGSLFALETEVSGQPENRYRLNAPDHR
ncbi:MAG: SMP-30/gluconolactonase/LRE family protein [Acetobacteraceae bacterium]|nr:SMP-30/gluconolactonase/LRE family protein [Acetobacteraceae bacterium]MBV8398627.1 SMP-30/gluconolactonase/LRE family protein [Acetobacteraceae bacterium]